MLTELQNISVNETLDVDASWRSDNLENHQQPPCNNTTSDENSVEREVRSKKNANRIHQHGKKRYADKISRTEKSMPHEQE